MHDELQDLVLHCHFSWAAAVGSKLILRSWPVVAELPVFIIPNPDSESVGGPHWSPGGAYTASTFNCARLEGKKAIQETTSPEALWSSDGLTD